MLKWWNNFNFNLRTTEEHAKHCEALDIPGLGKYFSRTYDLKYYPTLNELEYFNVIGGMTPDIVYDVLEGILPKLTSLFLHHCSIEKVFQLSKLNSILELFN